MCRLAAFPPGTTQEQAHEIVAKFFRGNDDGVGSVHVKGGQFQLNKYPYSYTEALAKKDKLFDHMPYAGWTLAHVRFATHGKNEYKNTHPIVRGDIAVVHNGVFSASDIIKAAISDSVKWSGETDSEVGAYMLNKLGAKDFYNAMTRFSAGVFVALHRDGSLTAVKTSGDLKALRNENDTVILASEFPWGKGYYNDSEVGLGIIELDKDGHPKNFSFPKDSEKKESHSHGRHESRTSCYSSDTTTRTYGGYEPRDIGFPKSFPVRNPSVYMSQNGVVSPYAPSQTIANRRKPLDLWEWFTEEELSRCELEGMS